MNTVKALNPTGDRIGGYLIRFGNVQQRDLDGEFFTPQTEYGLNWPIPVRPMFYHHGKDPNVKGVLIGVIDTLRADDTGIWAEAQIDQYNRYHKAIAELVKRGVLAWSSGTLPNLAKKARNGQIIAWPIIEGSLTPTPTEPRGTGVAHLADPGEVERAYKSLNLPTNLMVLANGDEWAAQESGPGTNDSQQVVTNPTNHNRGGVMLTQEDVQHMIAEAVSGLRDELVAAQPAETSPHDGLSANLSTTPVSQAAVQPPVKPTKALPIPRQPTRVEVIRATKYSDLSAPAMSFMAEVLGNTPDWEPTPAFYRELADKSFKAVERGELPQTALNGLYKAGYTKANELMTIGTAIDGGNWAADSWRAQLWQKVRQDNVVAPLFDMVEMPTNPYELPLESADPTVYYVPETSDQTQQVYTAGNPIPQSKAATGKTQMSAKKLALRLGWSGELNEDSIIPLAETAQRQAIRAMQNAIDHVLVNGDTATALNTNVNLIDSTPTGMTKYLAFNGLRKFCLVTNVASQTLQAAGSVTLALLRRTRFLLDGAYALRPGDCAWIVDNATYQTLLNMPEFVTLDKAGNAATNLTGQVGAVDGIPVFASGELGLAQSGAVGVGGGKISSTGSNNSDGQALIVFRPGWMIGYRRQVKAALEYLPGWDSYHLVVTARLCLVSFDSKVAAELYDLTV